MRDVGARGHWVTLAQRMSPSRGRVVENQRSVQRTARRDHTTPFSFVLAEFFERPSKKKRIKTNKGLVVFVNGYNALYLIVDGQLGEGAKMLALETLAAADEGTKLSASLSVPHTEVVPLHVRFASVWVKYRCDEDDMSDSVIRDALIAAVQKQAIHAPGLSERQFYLQLRGDPLPRARAGRGACASERRHGAPVSRRRVARNRAHG